MMAATAAMSGGSALWRSASSPTATLSAPIADRRTVVGNSGFFIPAPP